MKKILNTSSYFELKVPKFYLKARKICLKARMSGVKTPKSELKAPMRGVRIPKFYPKAGKSYFRERYLYTMFNRNPYNIEICRFFLQVVCRILTKTLEKDKFYFYICK
jgi:hypothetical protein